LHAAPRRALVWVGPNSDADSPANDPSHAAKWLPTRTIRAALIGWLTADPEARPYVHPSGVGFGGALITGRLDLSYLTLSSPLTIMSSAIPQGVDFSFPNRVVTSAAASRPFGLTSSDNEVGSYE
jgi:hypothetical protein